MIVKITRPRFIHSRCDSKNEYLWGLRHTIVWYRLDDKQRCMTEILLPVGPLRVASRWKKVHPTVPAINHRSTLDVYAQKS